MGSIDLNINIGRMDIVIEPNVPPDTDFVLELDGDPFSTSNASLSGGDTRSLAGKPLAGFRATPSRRIPVLYGMVVYVIRFNNQLFHRQSTLGKRRLGENRGFRPSF